MVVEGALQRAATEAEQAVMDGFRLANVEGKGRVVIATRAINSGEVALRESPLLTWLETEPPFEGLLRVRRL